MYNKQGGGEEEEGQEHGKCEGKSLLEKALSKNLYLCSSLLLST